MKKAEKSMEQMVKMLHDEWSRTGKTKAEVFLTKQDAEMMGAVITDEIKMLHIFVDNEEVLFKESLQYSKEAFIYLRIAKKMKKAYEKTAEDKIVMALDKEELARFNELAPEGGVQYWERAYRQLLL